MDTVELRAAAARLLNLHQRFAPCFGRREWVTADEKFGCDGGFLEALEQGHQRYLLEVPADTTVWAEGGKVPELTLDMAFQLVRAALAHPVVLRRCRASDRLPLGIGA